MKQHETLPSGYACRKLYEALDCLIADGPITDRLRGAALHLVNINPEVVPEDAQGEFAELKKELSAALADFLPNADAVRVARKLLSLYGKMSGAPHWQTGAFRL